MSWCWKVILNLCAGSPAAGICVIFLRSCFVRLSLHLARLPVRLVLSRFYDSEPSEPSYHASTRMHTCRLQPPRRMGLPGRHASLHKIIRCGLQSCRLWYVDSGRCARVLPDSQCRDGDKQQCLIPPCSRMDHKEAVYFATFSPDSKQARIRWLTECASC